MFDEIAGKNSAIHAYNKIIWTIRSGVLTLIFIGWGYLLKGVLEDAESIENIQFVVSILSIVTAIISVSSMVIDRNYLRRKYRVINIYDKLTEWIIVNNQSNIDASKLEKKQQNELVDFLKISGDRGDKSYIGKGYSNALRTCYTLYSMLVLFSIGVIIFSNLMNS